jgi:ribonuclease P protein component
LLLHVLNKLHVHSLRKHEILRKKLPISLLFKRGRSLKGDFLKMVYASLNPENNCAPGIPAILFAVSKKTVPSSVQRNRVKRMMREAYRLEKSHVERREEAQHEESASEQLCIAFLYTGRKKTFPNLDAFREEISRLLHNMTLS